MIKDFLIISCTGKDDYIGLSLNNNFFIKKIQSKINKNEILIKHIYDIIKENNVNCDENFSVIINNGPGRFSTIRAALAIAKGIKIAKGVKLFGFNNSKLSKFDHKNVELLIKKKLIENKLIKPIYLS
jgi:tRNA A37 threonylcarbamoyladenosine modification protein TsaB